MHLRRPKLYAEARKKKTSRVGQQAEAEKQRARSRPTERNGPHAGTFCARKLKK